MVVTRSMVGFAVASIVGRMMCLLPVVAFDYAVL